MYSSLTIWSQGILLRMLAMKKKMMMMMIRMMSARTNLCFVFWMLFKQ